MQNKLEWYELMNRRGALGKEDSFDYGLTVNADKGESELLQIFVGSFNQSFWWRRNLWLARQVECDLLIVTHAKIYVLNAKYYNGDFAYRDSMAYFNGKPLQNDPLATFQQSLRRLRKLLVDLGVNAVVEGRVVFMNPNYNVAIDDSAGVECVAR